MPLLYFSYKGHADGRALNIRTGLSDDWMLDSVSNSFPSARLAQLPTELQIRKPAAAMVVINSQESQTPPYVFITVKLEHCDATSLHSTKAPRPQY